MSDMDSTFKNTFEKLVNLATENPDHSIDMMFLQDDTEELKVACLNKSGELVSISVNRKVCSESN